jgi:hypothetical protein
MLELILTSPVFILLLVLVIVIAVSYNINKLIKSKREISTTLKHGNTEVGIKVSNGNDKNEEEDTPKESINEATECDLDKLTNHRFFTSILCQYTSDNCAFNLYNETIRLGVIKDDEEMAYFKKMLASKYINKCLFKVLGKHVKKWIDDIVIEVNKTNNITKAPTSFYSISQYITQYKTEAYKESKSIDFKYKNKEFFGIPTKFINRFNAWSDLNMNRVYDMISDVIYSTQNTWFAKTIELLDLFEIIFIMLHDQMDATLIILNGELASFVNKIKEQLPDESN